MHRFKAIRHNQLLKIIAYNCVQVYDFRKECSQLRVDTNCHRRHSVTDRFSVLASEKLLIIRKMLSKVTFISLLATLISGIHAKSVELTFELPDNAVECFYEQIENNTSASLEYQVKFIIHTIISRPDCISLAKLNLFCNNFVPKSLPMFFLWYPNLKCLL